MIPPNIDIPQGTFVNINIKPLFDDGNKDPPKYPKRTLRHDFSHMIQQQQIHKYVSTIWITTTPPLDSTSQSAPLLLTLPNTTTSIDMGPPMNILSGRLNVFENTPMVPQRKNIIDITPIPPTDVDHYQVNMIDQWQSSNPPTHQERNPKLTFQSMRTQQNQQQVKQYFINFFPQLDIID